MNNPAQNHIVLLMRSCLLIEIFLFGEEGSVPSSPLELLYLHFLNQLASAFIKFF